MNENIYRWIAIVIFLCCAGISIYFRRKADRIGGDRISSRVEGLPIMISLRLFGLALWLGVLLYLINPTWMSWSQFEAPVWFRLTGAGLGLLAAIFAYWVFSHLGKNVTQTVITRANHQLVVDGPYRLIRHPLYTMGFIALLSFSMLAANWYIAGMNVLSFLILNIRVPMEEANLMKRFGEEYRSYMKRTGRYLPKIWWGNESEGKPEIY
jgi:protein-S-isoprenylcysteine O-methyltransferase Ste14